MFERGSKWAERLDRVRWDESERAFYYLDQYYIKPLDFREVAVTSLEQLLMLSESKTAQKVFEGLSDSDYREAFQSRVRYHLDQMLAADGVDRKMAVRSFSRVVNDINEETVQLPEELVVSELMRGALEPLDDYTSMFWPTDAEEFDKHTNGEFVGVGIQIIKNALDEIEVSSPIEDTPAYRAGIQSGDIIISADGKDLTGYSLNEAVKEITGPEGTPVTVGIRRDGKKLEFDLVREMVKLRSVKGVKRQEGDPTQWDHWLDKDNGVGYARVANFQANTMEDLYNIIRELKSQGMKGLIVDLRRNPGGLLQSAYTMSSLFLKKGDVVVGTKGRHPSDSMEFEVQDDGPFVDLPLVVLVNGDSASASEIFAGAVKDNNRGTIVGNRTYGKFSVQSLVPLGRTNAKLKITTASYYLPNGKSAHRYPDSTEWGVEPDISVPLATKEKYSIYLNWRGVDRLASKDGDVKDDAKSAGKKKDTGKTADAAEDTEDTDGDYQRFRIKGMNLAYLVIIEPDEEKNEPLTVKLYGDEVGVLAKDAKGNPVDITNMKLKFGEFEVKARNAAGEPVEIAFLAVDGKEAERCTLPRLEQPDDSERPKIDPQLDAALLVLRTKLLSEWFPSLAAAELGQKIEVKPNN